MHRTMTDWDQRVHVEVDANAKLLDCFLVTLPPYQMPPGLLVYRAGAEMSALFQEALTTVARLKTQPRELLHPPEVFQPFGIVTARSLEDVSREWEIERELLIGESARTAEFMRVASQHSTAEAQARLDTALASLSRAVDLLGGAPLPRRGQLFRLSDSKLN